MSTSPAFTTSPPLSPTRQKRREQILNLAGRRGWLVAPRAASVVEACHSAWKAGTLPEVSFIPSPPSCQNTGTQSADSDGSESELKPSSTSITSPNSNNPSPTCERIDLLCGSLSDMNVNRNKARDTRPISLLSDPYRSEPAAYKSVENNAAVLELQRHWVGRRKFLSKQTESSSINRGNNDASVSKLSSDSNCTIPLTTSQGRNAMQPPSVDRLGGNIAGNQPPSRRGHARDPPSPMLQHLRCNINVHVHAKTTPLGPTPFQDPAPRNAQSPFQRSPRRTVDASHLVSEQQQAGLKFSHQWLHPGSFLKTRDASARSLLRMFDRALFEGALTSDIRPKVTLGWNARLNRTAGITKMKQIPTTGERRATIELSTKVIDEPDRLYKTLAHELCHAAAWIIDNTSKPPHGAVFKSWAERFRQWDANLKITRCHDYEINYKYNYKCVKCSHTYGRHSKSIDTTKKVCGVCRSTLKLTTAP
ncbi:unnamed protein product [Agarophyton chilense]